MLTPIDMTDERIALETLIPLNEDERLTAKEQARELVKRKHPKPARQQYDTAGSVPDRQQYSKTHISDYPVWVTKTIGVMLLIAFVGAFLTSAFNVFSAGRNHFASIQTMQNGAGVQWQAVVVGIAIVLLGDGKEKSALQQEADQMGLANVFFLPPVPKTGMSLALAGCDACVGILKPIPLYATVYPNKIFDYMAAGKPVILAIDGVVRQVVEEARAGVFVPPGNAAALANAIREMAGQPLEAREMGRRGRRFVEEHFDRAVLAEKLVAVLEKV